MRPSIDPVLSANFLQYCGTDSELFRNVVDGEMEVLGKLIETEFMGIRLNIIGEIVFVEGTLPERLLGLNHFHWKTKRCEETVGQNEEGKGMEKSCYAGVCTILVG